MFERVRQYHYLIKIGVGGKGVSKNKLIIAFLCLARFNFQARFQDILLTDFNQVTLSYTN